MFALSRSLGTSFFSYFMSPKELVLAERIKQGHYTKEDIQRIQTLIENPISSDYQLFFNNGDAQRKVIKGLIDETITDHNLLNAIIQGLRLEQCTPQINQENQISLIGKAERKEALHRLMSEQQEMHFLLKFFRDIPEKELNELEEELEKLMISTKEKDKDTYAGTNSTPTLQVQNQDTSALEEPETRSQTATATATDSTIGNAISTNAANTTPPQRVEGNTTNLYQIINTHWNAFFFPTTLNHADLATAITRGSYSEKEQQRLEQILSDLVSPDSAQFFQTLEVQQAILTSMNTKLFKAMLNCPDFEIDNTIKTNLAKAVVTVFFGTDSGQAIAPMTPNEQIMITRMLELGLFNHDETTLTAIAENLHAFTDLMAQWNIADAIKAKKFGENSAILTAIAKGLDIFTDREHQVSVAQAINQGLFGANETTLIAIAANLRVFQFADGQWLIANAIAKGQFGTNPAVLLALIHNLDIFTHTVSMIQNEIADAIENEKFSTDPNVLLALAKKLPIFTEQSAQKKVALAIKHGKFGTSPDVMQAIRGNLHIFILPDTQKLVELTIQRFTTENVAV